MLAPTIIMRTTRGVYTLDLKGYVLARSDGPRGWDYGRGWRILGFRRHWNAHHMVNLTEALAGIPIGQGWIDDWDHGTRRQWGDERMVSIKRLPA